MYITRVSSTVMRPKSIATVVVTFDCTLLASSTPLDSVVIAASVVSGGISETADTKVVFPTPNPPATTSLTDVTCREARRPRSACSECPYTFDHPRQGRQLQLDRVAIGGLEATRLDEIADEHHRYPEGHRQFSRNFRDRPGLPARVDDAR